MSVNHLSIGSCFAHVVVFGLLLPQSLLAVDFSAAHVHNWHQWRGPSANGVAPFGDPPIQWDQQRNIRWKASLPGEGVSTPIIWQDQVFVLSAIKTDRVAERQPQAHATAKTKPPRNYYRFVVLCLDRNTGQIRWQQTACEQVPHEGHHTTNTYAGASPTTDGQRLYVSFGSRGIYCYDLTGQLQWKRDLGDMRTRYGWGEGASPVVHDDWLIVNWDHEDDSFITAMDAATGQTRWKVDRPDEASSWATPLVVQHAGRTQVVVNGTGRARGYDLKTGQVIWQCGGQTVNVIPCPVAVSDFVVCMSGYRGQAAYAIPLNARGDLTDSDRIRWNYHRGTPYVPSPLAYGDLLYFTRSNSAVMSCLDIHTGQPVIEGQRLSGLDNLYASPAGAAGRIYFAGRDGTTLVIKHGTEFEVLAVNKLDDPIDASPAIVGDQLFLRSRKYLYCIQNTDDQ